MYSERYIEYTRVATVIGMEVVVGIWCRGDENNEGNIRERDRQPVWNNDRVCCTKEYKE